MGRAASIAVGAVFLLGVLAATQFVRETATVILGIPAQRVQADLTLTGGPAEGVLPTQTLTVTVTDTLAGAASPATVGSTFATGEVVFTFHSSCTRECGTIRMRVPPGSDLFTDAGVHYVTLADEWFGTTSSPVPVRAVLPGTSGNTGAGTIVNFGYNEAPGLAVTNPHAIIGGTDRQTHVVSESDLDNLAHAVTAEAITDAKSAMRIKAGGLGYALAGTPSLTTTSSDAVGTETQTFTVTTTATLKAVAFYDSATRGQLKYAVLEKVQPDHVLTKDSVETEYSVDSVTADGEVLIRGTATAFVIPRISIDRLQSRLAGLDVAQARKVIAEAVPSSTVRIQVWPAWVSRLPSLPDNIAIEVESLPAAA